MSGASLMNQGPLFCFLQSFLSTLGQTNLQHFLVPHVLVKTSLLWCVAHVQNQESIRESEQSSAVIKQLEAQLEEAQRQEAAAKAVLDAQRIGARSGKILGNQELREITQSVLNPPSMAADGVVPRGAAAGGGMLAGLFGGAAKAAAQDAQEEVCCFAILCFVSSLASPWRSLVVGSFGRSRSRCSTLRARLAAGRGFRRWHACWPLRWCCTSCCAGCGRGGVLLCKLLIYLFTCLSSDLRIMQTALREIH
jgi:hypothetical protein